MIFFSNKKLQDGKFIFEAFENEKLLGSCILKIEKDIAVCGDIKNPCGDISVIEGLIKTAFNFAANRGIYTGRIQSDTYVSLFKNFGFEEKNGIYESDIPTILSGSCCKKG